MKDWSNKLSPDELNNDGYTEQDIEQLELEQRYYNENIERKKLKITDHAPFITGSFAYGDPTGNSDIDLVVLNANSIDSFLRTLSEKDNYISFGRLNIISCTDVEQFDLWAIGTIELKDHKKKTGKPVDKKLAKFHFDVLRTEKEVADNYHNRSKG